MGRGRDDDGGVEIPPDEERCARNDGKGWRCKKPRSEGYKMCLYHLPNSVKATMKLNQPPKSEEREIRTERKDIVYTRKKGGKPREQQQGEEKKKEGDEDCGKGEKGEQSHEKVEDEVKVDQLRNPRKRGRKDVDKSGNLLEDSEGIVSRRSNDQIGKKWLGEKERDEEGDVGSDDIENEEDEGEGRRVSRKKKKKKGIRKLDGVEGREDDRKEVGSELSGGKQKKKREVELCTTGVRENGAEKKEEGSVATERPRRSASLRNLNTGASNEDKKLNPRIGIRDENVRSIR